MHEQRESWVAHLVLILGIAIVAFPLYLTFVASTLSSQDIAQVPMSLLPGSQGFENYTQALLKGEQRRMAAPVSTMLANSFFMAMVIALGKIVLSILSAYAVVFFRFPGRTVFFWLIFITLMLPIEVRIVPTYEVVSNLGLINTFGGLTLPLLASATGTLLFRQFFLTIPDEYMEAARMDGAGPLRFFWDILLPLSKTNIAALFVILFIFGWNQYLWPLLITSNVQMDTIVVGIKKMIATGAEITDWGVVMSTTMLALLPPVLVVVLMQRWFVKGLVETEK
jgi:sn-glycerol 3-phosphate transport system permease protein